MIRRLPDRDWVDAYYDRGLDVEARRVWLTGEITERATEDVIKGLYLLDSIDTKEPAELFLNCLGGDLVQAFAIYDIIQTLRCPVHTFAFGRCQSATPLLLAVGRQGHRWVTTHCEFMAHSGEDSLDGRTADLKAQMERGENLDKIWLNLITAHSSMSYAHWRSICNRKTDYYFTADEAIKWGIADHIWVEQ